MLTMCFKLYAISYLQILMIIKKKRPITGYTRSHLSDTGSALHIQVFYSLFRISDTGTLLKHIESEHLISTPLSSTKLHTFIGVNSCKCLPDFAVSQTPL